jgi:hypothetical protein
MTTALTARIAGGTMLLYRVIGVWSFLLYENSLGGRGADRVMSVAANAGDLRLATVMTMVYMLLALVLGTTLYLYTREGGAGLATFGLVGRTAEAALYGVFAVCLVAMVSIATSSTDASRVIDSRLVREIALTAHRVAMAGCMFFAAGNAAFAWVLVRARLAPRWIAVLGVFAAVLPLVGLPLQIIGALRGYPTPVMWLATFLFELLFGVWLLTSRMRDER